VQCSTTSGTQCLAATLYIFKLLLQVLVVGNAVHQQQLRSWAASAGLPSSCIITSSSCTGILQGLTAAAAANPSLADNYVLAANASFVLEPGTSLSRLVEAAVVRGKDTISCTVPFEGADLSQLVQVRAAAAMHMPCIAHWAHSVLQLLLSETVGLASWHDTHTVQQCQQPLL
jgi:hypothetical protein